MLKRILAGMGKVRSAAQGADQATAPPRYPNLAALLSVPEDVFAQAIKAGIQAEPPNGHVMVLVAYKNAKPVYEAAKQISGKRGKTNSFIKSLLDRSGWSQDEVNERRYAWYFYGFSLLSIADIAEGDPKINLVLSDIWFILSSSAGYINKVLEHNIIWRPEEKEWFSEIKNESDGIRYVANILVPKLYRDEPRIKRLREMNEDRAERDKRDAAQGYPSVKPEYVEAVKRWRLAAKQGDAATQRNLGSAYLKGHGVPSNDAEAAKWFQLAAEQGDVAAQNSLGSMYAHGYGVPQDDAEAVKWWRLAAERGNAEAQWNLGKVYVYYDAGVPTDYVQAYMWFNLAAARGSEDAVKSRDFVAARMTADQLNEAQRLVRNWKPKQEHL